jgi:hypothetical protein
MELSEANRVALAQVAALAESERPRHVARIRSILAAARVHADATALLDAVRSGGSVTMNFHPDRLLADGRSVAQALHDEGVYRSQFETRISNGGLTAYPGGDRDVWEHALFAGAYQRPEVLACERPKYGGLNLMNHLNGERRPSERRLSSATARPSRPTSGSSARSSRCWRRCLKRSRPGRARWDAVSMCVRSWRACFVATMREGRAYSPGR